MNNGACNRVAQPNPISWPNTHGAARRKTRHAHTYPSSAARGRRLPVAGVARWSLLTAYTSPPGRPHVPFALRQLASNRSFKTPRARTCENDGIPECPRSSSPNGAVLAIMRSLLSKEWSQKPSLSSFISWLLKFGSNYVSNDAIWH